MSEAFDKKAADLTFDAMKQTFNAIWETMSQIAEAVRTVKDRNLYVFTTLIEEIRLTQEALFQVLSREQAAEFYMKLENLHKERTVTIQSWALIHDLEGMLHNESS